MIFETNNKEIFLKDSSRNSLKNLLIYIVVCTKNNLDNKQ